MPRLYLLSTCPFIAACCQLPVTKAPWFVFFDAISIIISAAKTVVPFQSFLRFAAFSRTFIEG